MTIKNIFFDFDGVVAESVNVKTQAFYDLYLPYGEAIAQKALAHHREHGGMSRYEKFRIYHKELLGQDINDDQVDDLAQQFSNLVVDGVIASPEVTGAGAFLKKYHQQFKCWIITGTPTPEMERIAKARGLQDYFIGIHGSPTKKPIWTEHLIKEFDLKREETLFLGDATTDYKAAVHSKLHFALRSYDENTAYFKDYDGWRFSDFTDFEEQLLSKIA